MKTMNTMETMKPSGRRGGAAGGAMIRLPVLGALPRVPWAIAAAAVVAALWYRGEVESCRAAVAAAAAEAEARLNVQKAADAAFTRGLERELAPITRAIEEQAHATAVALAKVPSNPNCARTPAADAFDGSVRPGRQPAPAGAARPAGR